MPNTRHTCPSTRLIYLIPGNTQPTIRGRTQSEVVHNQRPHTLRGCTETSHRDPHNQRPQRGQRPQSEAVHNQTPRTISATSTETVSDHSPEATKFKREAQVLKDTGSSLKADSVHSIISTIFACHRKNHNHVSVLSQCRALRFSPFPNPRQLLATQRLCSAMRPQGLPPSPHRGAPAAGLSGSSL